MNEEKNKRKGLVGTLIFHGLLLVLFIFYGLKVPLPLPAERGIIIDLGYSEEGSPGEETLPTAPQTATEIREANQAQQNPSQNPEEILTSDLEDAPAIKKQPSKNPTKSPNTDTKTNENKSQEESPEKQREIDSRALFPGKKAKSGGDESGDAGNQGQPDGQPDGMPGSGESGGGGVSLDLGGRQFVIRPVVKDKTQVKGKVVVEIVVDREGRITGVQAGARGTTIPNTSLWKKCEDALKGARISALSQGPEFQKGQVTFYFELQ